QTGAQNNARAAADSIRAALAEAACRWWTPSRPEPSVLLTGTLVPRSQGIIDDVLGFSHPGPQSSRSLGHGGMATVLAFASFDRDARLTTRPKARRRAVRCVRWDPLRRRLRRSASAFPISGAPGSASEHRPSALQRIGGSLDPRKGEQLG